MDKLSFTDISGDGMGLHENSRTLLFTLGVLSLPCGRFSHPAPSQASCLHTAHTGTLLSGGPTPPLTPSVIHIPTHGA